MKLEHFELGIQSAFVGIDKNMGIIFHYIRILCLEKALMIMS